jgi:hypothetical protein
VGGANLEEPFERTIEVSDEMTLGTLHDTIQELTGCDNDHLFTFFIARGPRGQRTSVVETDQREGEQDCLYEIPLREVFPLEQNMKLFYWFDFGDDWMFQIQQRRQPKPEDSGTEYPKVIRDLGPKHIQNKNKNSPQRSGQERPERGPGWASIAACLPRRSRTGADEVALSKQLVSNSYGTAIASQGATCRVIAGAAPVH